eukprot:CFRG3203T1
MSTITDVGSGSPARLDFTTAYGGEENSSSDTPCTYKRTEVKLGADENIASVAKEWPSLRGKTGYSYDHSLAIAELSRNSSFRSMANERGMLRPFLILASMHPVRRRVWASYLNLSVQKKSFKGDAHAEAWYILSHKTKGVVRKVSIPVKDKLVKTAKDDEHTVYWDEVVSRVTRNGISEVTLLNRKNKDIDKSMRVTVEDRLQAAEELAKSNTLAATRELEEILLSGIFEITREAAGEQMIAKMNMAVERNPVVAADVRKRCMDAGHFSDETFLDFFSGGMLLEDAEKTEMIRALRKYCLKRRESRKRNFAVLGVGTIMLTVGPVLLTPFSLIFSVPFFATNIFRTVYKSKPGELLPIIIACVMQRAFLAAGGVDLDYYCS